ncbi:hypothetical protein ELY21_03100 [Legionella sp. km535]|uniref:hypothetical protein n=1 Tax=Legionella sp. km535 TaxID=2498107 RepID=UPI000F8F2E2F|nr:hypothetical protein [Legionella sp. km535]RUR20050.1 hypothetical protein ELY21_03100 [Legionella sp. km535]
MRLPILVSLCILVVNLSGCEQVALMATPPKKANDSKSKLAVQAKHYFWTSLHHGRYLDIPRINYLLTAAYLENPDDPQLAAYLGFTHIWNITERFRTQDHSPLITNEIVLSKKYFLDALQLDPHNPIYQGFYGDTQLIDGQIYQDKQEEVRGYFTLKKAIQAWPQFNYFTAGYPMSSLPADSEHYKEGLQWQWKTLDLCSRTKINRNNPDYHPYMNKEIHTGKQRACWNSIIAPHNFEGFFMNMGDMLVKSGDVETGIIIYKNAKLSKTYNLWPYKEMLEQRILNARNNAVNFNKKAATANKSILFNSGYGCVVCHQK